MLPFGTPHGFLPTSVPSFGVSNAQHFPQQHLMPLHNPQMAPIIPRPSDVQTIPIPIPGSTTMSEWSEHKTPEGKIYYYNRVKKISLWSKPDELKTADEVKYFTP